MQSYTNALTPKQGCKMDAEQRKTSVLERVKARAEAKAAKAAQAEAAAGSASAATATPAPAIAAGRADTLRDGVVDDAFSDSDEEAEMHDNLYTPDTKPKQRPQQPEDLGLHAPMQVGGLRIDPPPAAKPKGPPSKRAAALRAAHATDGAAGADACGTDSGGGCCVVM